MPSNFCLLPKQAEELKSKIVSGEIDIDKLSKMSSAGRNSFFANLLGERNAKEVNSLFESKLLLKNQKRGLVNWAKQVTGLKPEVRRDLISRIDKMKELLSPESEDTFLKDLVSKRLGTDISREEAKKIVDMSNKIESLADYKNDAERVKYGKAKLGLTEYVNTLNPKKASLATNIAGIPRSLIASLDLSAPFNQGWGLASRKQFYSSMKDMFKYLKSDENLLELQADIITRPNYKIAKKAGLRLTDLSDKLENREEALMTTLLDKVPGIKASQRAYTGFLNKVRMDVFDDLVKKAELAGEDVSIGSKELEDLAKSINNFSGGARVGKIEGATPFLNALFFSPRKIVSTFNMLNPINYINPKISKTARKASIRNLLGSLAITATLVSLADILGGKDITVEKDPTSADFGTIKSGDTRLDLSGGNKSYVNLIARLATGKTKSSTTGNVYDLGGDFGQTSKADLIARFLQYKLSPNMSLLLDAISGTDAMGEEKTITQSVLNRFKPMFAESIIELLQDDSNGVLSKILFTPGALFGGGLSTYTSKKELKKLKKIR